MTLAISSHSESFKDKKLIINTLTTFVEETLGKMTRGEKEMSFVERMSVMEQVLMSPGNKEVFFEELPKRNI